ncbi:hypothetical protein AYI69_g4052 [Smittium culicis]|uniref:Vps72/YL1 C-terminal domain-containing protein n=1 Tax=Smittium culicis TaxID=133412 RepID=A0A1R1YH23_9FUNG|nr:hypothetical protein AYI69_g4052 [Smittium culicis]
MNIFNIDFPDLAPAELDSTDSDFEETDSETEAASLKAISEIELLILKRQERLPKRGSLRENAIQSTIQSAELQKRKEIIKQESMLRRVKHKIDDSESELTQEQLLEEAKKTEKENTESLIQMVLEQEQILNAKINSFKFKKPALQFPIFQCRSFSEEIGYQEYDKSQNVPKSLSNVDSKLVIDITDLQKPNINCDSEIELKLESEPQFPKTQTNTGSFQILADLKPEIATALDNSNTYPNKKRVSKFELNILEDENVEFIANKWVGSTPLKRPTVCPITGKKAKYIHPKTGIPFHDVFSYRALEKLSSNGYAFDGNSLAWVDF